MKKLAIAGIGLIFLLSCSVNKTLTMGNYQGKHYYYENINLSLFADSSFTIESCNIKFAGKWIKREDSVYFKFCKPTEPSANIALALGHTIPIDQAYSVTIINKNKLLDADHTILKKVK